MIVVPDGASYDDMIAAKNDKEIGDKINKVISALAEENDLKGVIDVADFNDEDRLGKGKEMVDRLTKLVGIFEIRNVDNTFQVISFCQYADNFIDLLADFF